MPPAGPDGDLQLWLVALHRLVQAVRDSHSALLDGLGVWSHLQQSLAHLVNEFTVAALDRELSEVEAHYVVGYALPNGGTGPCRSE